MNKKYYIAETKHKGKGLFSSINIKEGELILKFDGNIMSLKDTINLDKRIFGFDMGNGLQINDNEYIYPKGDCRLANHSCNPNCGIKNDIELIAIRDILKGEELTFDYSTTMHENYWTMKCNCGSLNCRGIVKDFIHLDDLTKKLYLSLGVVQRFIITEYDNLFTNQIIKFENLVSSSEENI